MNEIVSLVEGKPSPLSSAIELPPFLENGDAISLRDAAIAIYKEAGLIPADAIAGWLGCPSRRNGCGPEQHVCLNALNAYFSRAKIFYGQKKQKKIFVSYARVSSPKQGATGYGLEAQLVDIRGRIRQMKGVELGVFSDVASGKNIRRTGLQAAMDLCKQAGATLIVSSVCRLARNTHFVLDLLQLKLNFVLVDHPHASPREIAHLAVDAEYDRERCSQNTKKALAVARKRKGNKGKRNLTVAGETMSKERSAGQ